jgi:NTP pyrophosphatase (non-canonical NTP hydrolase)
MRIRDLQLSVFQTASVRGFHEGEPNIWTCLGNIHGEVSEAWEEARKPDFDPKRTYYRKDGKPEGLPAELADIVIRALDTAQSLGIDMEKAIAEKEKYNQTRPYRHGNKRC